MTSYESGPGAPPGPGQRAAAAGTQAAAATSDVAATAKEKARDVADTAGQQAREVAGEARHQARGLAQDARTQLRSQATTQRDRASAGLRSLSDELDAMVTKGERSGPATELAREAAERARALAGYLDRREPGDLVEDVREFARRRPAVFLFGALAAGVLAGRLTRSVAAGAAGSGQPGRGRFEERTAAQDTEPLGAAGPATAHPAEEGAWPTPPPPVNAPRSRPQSRVESGTESW
jgi:hypothetical protein